MNTRSLSSFVSLSLLASISSFALQLETNNPAPAYPAATTGEKAFAQKSWNMQTSSAQEIVHMKEQGLDPNVIRAYVQSARVPYKATVDDIIYLHKNSVPDDLITEWINKGSDLVRASATIQEQQLAAAPQPAPAAPAVAPQPQVVYQAPQTVAAPPVVYTAPAYGYSDYSYWYPPISLSFGWGYPYWGHSYYSHYPYHYGYGHGYYGGSHYSGAHYSGGSWGGGMHYTSGGHWGGGGGHFSGGGGHHR